MKVFIALSFLAVVYSTPHVRFPGQELHGIRQPSRDLIDKARVGDSRIVNGENTNIANHPWQASLERLGSHICGASLIHESGWFVTAAHCVDGYWASWHSLRVGSSTRGSGGTTYTASQIIVHPNYSGSSSGVPNDIALIKVTQSVDTSGSGVSTIPIATSDYTGSTCVITGWGVTESGSLSSRLQAAYMTVISNSQCGNMMGGVSGASIFSSHVCVHEEGLSACNGDSGGPLVCDGRLVGATSWGISTCPGTYPSVYTRISSFRSWINSATGLDL